MDFAQSVERFTNAEIYQNQPMNNYTGYGVGGRADYFVKIKSLKDISDCIEFANDLNLQHKMVGKGTNLLFSDLGFKGVVIYTGELNRVYITKNTIKCMAGARLISFIELLNSMSISALNPLYGIPATIGGAVVMNAGSFGSCISQHIESVDVLDGGKIITINKPECGFIYRSSRLLEDKRVVVSVNFDMKSLLNSIDDKSALDYFLKRKTIQPTGRSCGSVFKNPQGEFAGSLIERAGLKGYNIGGAKVSEIHANFIITERYATALDVYNLIEHVKNTVNIKFGVKLTEEIEKVGIF